MNGENQNNNMNQGSSSQNIPNSQESNLQNTNYQNTQMQSSVNSNDNGYQNNGVYQNVQGSGVVPPVNNGTTLSSGINVSAIPQEIETEKPKKEKKKGKFGAFLSVIIILGAIACGAYYVYLQVFKVEAVDVYSKILKKYSSATSTYLNSATASASKNFNNDINVSVDTNIESIKALNDYTLNYLMSFDPDNSKMATSVALKENNNIILDGNIYITDNKLYLKSEKLYEKLLYVTEMEKNFSLDKFTAEDIAYIMSTSNQYLTNSILEKASFINGKAQLTIEGVKVNASNSIMTIDENQAKEIMISFIDKIKADGRILEIISKMSSMEVSDLVDELEASKSNMNFEKGTLKIETFTSKNKMVGLKASFNDKVYLNMVKNDEKMIVDFEDNTKIIFDKVSEDNYNFSASENSKVMITGTVKKSNDTYTVTANYSDIDIKFEFTMDDKYVVSMTNLEINYDKFNLVFKVTNDISIQNNKTDAVINVKYDNMYFNLNVNSIMTDGADFPSIDTSSAVDVNTLTEDDMKSINEKFEKIINDSKLKDLFNNDNLISDVVSPIVY